MNLKGSKVIFKANKIEIELENKLLIGILPQCVEVYNKHIAA